MSAIPKTVELLGRYPRPSDWLAFEADGRVRVRTGKVELGQGVLTALAQIAADELDVGFHDIVMESGDTDTVPNEGYTAGSLSIQQSGEAIRLVCAEVRGRIAAVSNGVDYHARLDALDLDAPVTGRHPPKDSAALRVVGSSAPRIDLPSKIGGAPFVHDLVLDGMLHARMIHPPRAGAVPANFEESVAAAGLDPDDVVAEGAFVAVLAVREPDARAAAERLGACLAWSCEVLESPLPDDHLEGRVTEVTPVADGPVAVGDHALRATFRKPYIAHAAIGPSCAVAHLDGNHLSVWTHSQGVFPLRDALAAMLDRPAGTITVRHVQGAGCYGHNGADDVAAEAAAIAVRRPGVPIRLLWSRADELAVSPAGTRMRIDLAAAVDDDGHIAAWNVEIWSGTHGQRPGMAGEVNLLAAALLTGATPLRERVDVPAAVGFGAERNARPIYAMGAFGGRYHRVAIAPVRTSSQRTLGAFANVFAIEMFMDELAARAGLDPFAFRRRNLEDARALALLDRLEALAADLDPAATGIALSRYKGIAGTCACAVEVEVEEAVRVRRVIAAVDAGRIVNPDGLRNQIEGGIVQGLSWALKESLPVAEGRVLAVSWEDYPILGFDEVPEIAVELIDRPEEPSVGVGEAAQGPVAGALGNAVARALGVPVRTLPLTPETITRAILDAG